MRRPTKQRFAEALKGLTEEKPLDRITVKEISERAGLTVATFYNHFRDKSGLVDWTLTTAMESIVSGATGEEDFRELARQAIQFGMENRAYLTNVYENRERPRSADRPVAEIASQLVESMILRRTGQESLSEEQRFALREYIHGSARVVYEFLRDGAPIAPDTMATYLTQALPANLAGLLGG